MKFSSKVTVKPLLLVALAVTTVLAPAGLQPAQAQGGGPGGGGMRGGMRNSPKGRLTRLVRGITQLEKDKRAPLSKDQARKIATAIKPWRSRKTMTDAQAKSLYMTVNNVLTAKQKNELDKNSAKNRRFGGDRPGGRDDRGGPGGPGGAPDANRMQQMRAQMQKMRGLMKTMNPFYPPSGYGELKGAPERMREGMNRRYQRQIQDLGAIARKGGVKW